MNKSQQKCQQQTKKKIDNVQKENHFKNQGNRQFEQNQTQKNYNLHIKRKQQNQYHQYVNQSKVPKKNYQQIYKNNWRRNNYQNQEYRQKYNNQHYRNDYKQFSQRKSEVYFIIKLYNNTYYARYQEYMFIVECLIHYMILDEIFQTKYT